MTAQRILDSFAQIVIHKNGSDAVWESVPGCKPGASALEVRILSLPPVSRRTAPVPNPTCCAVARQRGEAILAGMGDRET